ncbi:hypothetical protein [Cryptosporangium phraense]|uniref:Serine hydrolase n=1 Tax=Cryptosporangium phraense TaxID=2593070 RepID=A0A545AWW1_9ACTN|nr:hypothetical protein [Cryptosporangium phraense]TQS45761.1 hypothetical protein FL583_08625 [Cryptosporangium phraense]
MRKRLALAVLAAVALTLPAACSSGSADEPAAATSAPAVSTAPAPSAGGSASPSGCGDTTGWGCTWSPRLAAAAQIADNAPGRLGVVVLDRQTGKRWQTGDTANLYWTGSTIKLGLVATALEQSRTGVRELSDTDTDRIGDILSYSSDDAADALWREYGRAALLSRFKSRYGMTHATYVSGFDQYWGFVKCTPGDLVRMMDYILEKLGPADKDLVVTGMRQTDEIQHWGVWSAGESVDPGNKNGWSIEKDDGQDHWLTSSVGFAGDDERYVIAEMYSMPPGQDSLELGAHTLSNISAALFGQATPAPAVIKAS